ncbi:hypothetical protein [Deinococcus irradiatisoli]|nr:hypothetical protein [Deinococcus irradiatisoli]
MTQPKRLRRPAINPQPTPGRSAREYAELWYIALRVWSVREVELPPGNAGRYYPRDGSTEHLTMGEGGPIKATYLRTPAGDYTEQEVAQAIKTMTLSGIPETVQLGRMLSRLRDERSKTMVSLLRDGGWSSNREGAVRYGVAVLSLAVRLQDPQAELHLNVLRRVLARAEF